MSRNRAVVALAAWAALMCIVWPLFVPKGLSVGTFTLLTLSGPLLLAVVSVLRSAHEPAQSISQVRAEAPPATTTDGRG
jgi:hypothetical protein